MPFDFSNTKMNLEGINKYLESQGIKLTDSEKKQMNTIFQESDTWNDEQKANGSDGVLNATESALFVTKMASFSQKIKDGVNNLIKGLGLEFKPVRKEIEATSADATRVNNPVKDLIENISNNNGSVHKADKLTRFNTRIATNTSMTLKNPAVFDKEVFSQALNSLLKNNSKMKNMGSAFVSSSTKDLFKKPLNPFIVVAIAIHESAGGTSKPALQKNNVGGIMGKNGLRKFHSVEQCIDSITSTVNKRVGEGYTSISKVGNSGRYCAKSVGPQWSAQVASFAEKLRAKYEELLIQKYGQ